MIRKLVPLTTDSLTQKRYAGLEWSNEFKHTINELLENTLTFEDLEGYIDGLQLTYISDSLIDISTGKCVVESVDDYIVSNSTLNLDISTSGANGLDTGSVANNTWYYVWVIKNPTTGDVKGLFSTSSTSPTLPSGYTKKRLIGVLRYGVAGFLTFYQTGFNNDREILFESENYVVTQSTPTAGSWTTVSATSYVTTTLRSWALIKLSIYAQNSDSTQNANVEARIRPSSTSGTGLLITTINASNGNDPGDGTTVGWVKVSNGSFDYQLSSNSGSTPSYVDVAINGYRFEV